MKRNAKHCWIFFVLCTIQIYFLGTVYAQENIILEAEITNPIMQKCKNSYRITLPTKLRLTNRTEKPLLLIRDAVSIVGLKTARSESDLKEGIYFSRFYGLPSFIQKNLLNLHSPTPDRTEIIFQDGQYEWTSDEWYGFPKTTDDESNTLPGLSLEKLQSVDGLWIEFVVAFFPMNSMGEEGNKLQKNWKTFGHLLLDTKVTQPIKISIPHKIQKMDSCD